MDEEGNSVLKPDELSDEPPDAMLRLSRNPSSFKKELQGECWILTFVCWFVYFQLDVFFRQAANLLS